MSENLLKVAKGLKLVYIGLMLVVIAMVLGIVGGILIGVGGAVAAQGRGGAGAAAVGVPLLIVMGLVAVLAFAGNIVGLVGRFFCLATPPEAKGARPKIILSVIFEVCSLLNGMLNNADSLTLNFLPPAAKMISSGFGVLASIAAIVLFLLFARALAEFIRRKKLGEDAMSVLYFFGLTFILYLVGVLVAVGGVFLAGGVGGPGGGGGGGAAAAGAGGCIGLILMIAALIVGIVSLVKYAKLLTNLSDATRKFARTVDDDRDDDDRDDDYRPRRERDDEDDEPEDDLDDDRGNRRRRRD